MHHHVLTSPWSLWASSDAEKKKEEYTLFSKHHSTTDRMSVAPAVYIWQWCAAVSGFVGSLLFVHSQHGDFVFLSPDLQTPLLRSNEVMD